MKVISVIGYSNTGKTTTIEAIIKELKKRNYSVGTVKCSHHEFSVDTEGKNTYRHKKAGAELVTSRNEIETAILWPGKMDIYQLLQLYDQDYVIIEGESGVNAPNIVTGDSNKGIEEKINNLTILISGKSAHEISEYKGIKAISALINIEELVDFIDEKTFEHLPNYKEKYCNF